MADNRKNISVLRDWLTLKNLSMNNHPAKKTGRKKKAVNAAIGVLKSAINSTQGWSFSIKPKLEMYSSAVFIAKFWVLVLIGDMLFNYFT